MNKEIQLSILSFKNKLVITLQILGKTALQFTGYYCYRPFWINKILSGNRLEPTNRKWYYSLSNFTEFKKASWKISTRIYSWKIYFYCICNTLIYKIGDIVEGNVVVKTHSLLKVMKFDFLTMQRQSNIFYFSVFFGKVIKLMFLT